MNLMWYKYIYFLPDFGDTQYADSEYIIENGNENYIHIVN